MHAEPGPAAIDERVERLLDQMTVEEKIGQLTQVNVGQGGPPDELRQAIRAGKVGAVLDVVDVATVNELQRIAVHDSRLGIPLLVGRDVIHGFKTVLPIPLGQAAAWNPELVRQGARMGALEAAVSGVNWTFAPMIDIARDPRWGRIEETFGEDPTLVSQFGVAYIKGLQFAASRATTCRCRVRSRLAPSISSVTGRVKAGATTAMSGSPKSTCETSTCRPSGPRRTQVLPPSWPRSVTSMAFPRRPIPSSCERCCAANRNSRASS